VTLEERLEEELESLLGLPSARKIADLADSPQLEDEIREMRWRKLSVEFWNDMSDVGVAAATFNVLQAPWLYPLALGSKVMATNAKNSHREDSYFKLRADLQKKMLARGPMLHQVGMELRNKGFSESWYNLLYEIPHLEDNILGYRKMMAVVKPLAMSATSLTALPPLFALGFMGVALGLSLFYSWMGEENQKVQDQRGELYLPIMRADFLKLDTVSKMLRDYYQELNTRRKKQQTLMTASSSVPDLGFYLSTLILGRSDAGVMNLARSMFSTAQRQADMKVEELNLERTLAYIDALHNLVTNKYFLTRIGWDQYRIRKLEQLAEEGEKYRCRHDEPGVSFVHFKTRIPDDRKERYTPQLYKFIPAGKVLLLSAPSGSGKSVMSFGVQGFVETLGTIHFIDKDGSQRCLENLTQEELNDRVWYIRPGENFREDRVCDIFTQNAIAAYNKRFKAQGEGSLPQEEFMLTLPDAILERELCLLAAEIRKSDPMRDCHGYEHTNLMEEAVRGRKPMFEPALFDRMDAFRKLREKEVRRYMRSQSINLKEAKPYQPIGTLSTGMQLTFALQQQLYMHRVDSVEDLIDDGKARLYILEEPFGGLDDQTAENYAERIGRIRKMQPNSTIMIITHTHEGACEKVYQDDLIKKRMKKKYTL